VPPILEIGSVDGGFFAISERRRGRPIEATSRSEAEELMPAILDALDAMRLADLSETTGFGPWGVDGNGRFETWIETLLTIHVDRPQLRTAGWRSRLEASSVGSGPFERGYDALRELAGELDGELSEQRNLIHSDLLHGNVLVEADRIRAVLDWGSSIYGDFVLDLAWLAFWAPWYPEWRDLDIVGAALDHYRAIGLEVPGFEARLRACELWIGLDGQAYDAWAGHWANLEWTARRTLDFTT